MPHGRIVTGDEYLEKPTATDAEKMDFAAAALDQARGMEAKAKRLEDKAGWLRLRAHELRRKVATAANGVYGRQP